MARSTAIATFSFRGVCAAGTSTGLPAGRPLLPKRYSLRITIQDPRGRVCGSSNDSPGLIVVPAYAASGMPAISATMLKTSAGSP